MLLPSCYDEWIVPERERIHDLTVMALQKLISLKDQSRDYTAAIHIGQILLRLDPLDENLYIQLLHLHQHNNDLAGAIQVFQTAQETLERELGIGPGPILQQAYSESKCSSPLKMTRKKPLDCPIPRR